MHLQVALPARSLRRALRIARLSAHRSGHAITLAALGAALLCGAACSGNSNDRPAQVIAVPASGGGAAAGVALDGSKRGTMTVTGTATLEVSPDCADLTMTVSVEDSRPGPAATGAQAKQKELVAALRAVGVEASDLKLSELRISPVYADTPTYTSRPKITGYNAEIIITATTKQLTRIGALMEAGANAGATSMSSELRRSDMPELKKKVRDMALRAAKEKAKQTATTLEIKLGRIVNVIEAPTTPTWGRQLYSNYVGNSASSVPSSGEGLAGVMQPLTLDVTLELDLPPS